MNIDLGRVTPIYRGAYDAAESYELNDIVLHTDGALYWHTSETPTTGVAPTVTATWTLAFSGADVEAAIEAIKEDAEAIAFGTRGGLPVGSSDPYYHNNAAWYASQASASATDANAAKVAAQGAQGAAETARDKSAQWATGGSSGTPGATNNSKYFSEQAAGSAAAAAGSAQDAEAWATGGSSGTPSATNNAKYYSEQAAASAATFVTDPTLSVSGKAADAAAVGAFNQYISLREEEDRQILLGSVVQAVEDTYAELSSAPIHNAITIGGSVYPRMDNTRLGLDAIKGRTVAFNQLAEAADTHTTHDVVCTKNADGTITLNGTTDASGPLNTHRTFSAIAGHKYLIFASSNAYATGRGVYCDIGGSVGLGADAIRTASVTGNASLTLRADASVAFNNETILINCIDITAMYGTTLADSIYAMEQATPGAGVAYVRARLPLDYYAYNAGELVAPVVSGVGFVGFNQFDKSTATNNKRMNNGTEMNDTGRAHSDYIIVMPNTEYYVINGLKSAVGECVDVYDVNKQFIIRYYTSTGRLQITTPQSAAYAIVNYEMADADSVCFNLSNPSRNGEYQPYQHTSLSIPSTRLDGVGTAQDYIEVVEDGENDYSLHLHKVMGEVALGTLEWDMTAFGVGYPRSVDNVAKAPANTSTPANIVCAAYATASYDLATTGSSNKMIAINPAGKVVVRDTAYSDPAVFKTAMSGVMLAYELAAPTETVIAEHLTLADISAIAENGGIISVVNSDGDIVQPDAVFDTVISRSTS